MILVSIGRPTGAIAPPGVQGPTNGSNLVRCEWPVSRRLVLGSVRYIGHLRKRVETPVVA
jgi:hypothetical protein